MILNLLRKAFPKKLTRDELDFLKLITMTGYLLTEDGSPDIKRRREMSATLMAMWMRRVKGTRLELAHIDTTDFPG